MPQVCAQLMYKARSDSSQHAPVNVIYLVIMKIGYVIIPQDQGNLSTGWRNFYCDKSVNWCGFAIICFSVGSILCFY
jgi:hypothetical protein